MNILLFFCYLFIYPQNIYTYIFAFNINNINHMYQQVMFFFFYLNDFETYNDTYRYSLFLLLQGIEMIYLIQMI